MKHRQLFVNLEKVAQVSFPLLTFIKLGELYYPAINETISTII